MPKIPPSIPLPQSASLSPILLIPPVLSADDAVDLCRWRPLGSPLADLTSQCHDYTVCEQRGDGSLVERRLPCKKDFLFSQLRRRCVPEKKVRGGCSRRSWIL